MSLKLGDNTNATSSHLERQVLLCAGEDSNELMHALPTDSLEIQLTHEYRCYRFWRCRSRTDKNRSFALVWTGIGTGCIEPLLCEVLSENTPVEQIVLVGTAGQLASFDHQSPAARPTLMSRALLGPSALSALGAHGVLEPTLSVDAQTGTIFSTDLYYLWNQRTIPEWPGAGRFAEDWRAAQYVDMEVAQFYWLCRRFGKQRVQYAAIKGAANELGVTGQQAANSLAVLRACVSTALQAFEFPL